MVFVETIANPTTQVPDLDAIVCPIGGGGHLAGIAVAAKAINPKMLVVGAEPAGADDAALSFKAGRIIPSAEPRSIADGLLATVGALPFACITRLVDDILVVPDSLIVESMRRLWEVLKVIVEPSGAVGYAVVAQLARLRPRQRIGVVLTGGNLDLNLLPWQQKPRG